MSFGLSLAASVHYDVLRHVDLGANAASIHDGARASWSDGIAADFPSGPRADRVQVLPLITPNLPSLLAALRELGSFERTLAGVVADHATPFEARWNATRREHERRVDQVAEALYAPLAAARTALWSRVERAPPPLLVLDARPLGRHARGATIDQRTIVAASFALDDADLFCAIFHEETHAVSDAGVVRRDTQCRDTRRSSPGYAAHRALEVAALDLADDVVRASVPELAEHHTRWVEQRRRSLTSPRR